jgi:hypothetical protein
VKPRPRCLPGFVPEHIDWDGCRGDGLSSQRRSAAARDRPGAVCLEKIRPGNLENLGSNRWSGVPSSWLHLGAEAPGWGVAWGRGAVGASCPRGAEAPRFESAPRAQLQGLRGWPSGFAWPRCRSTLTRSSPFGLGMWRCLSPGCRSIWVRDRSSCTSPPFSMRIPKDRAAARVPEHHGFGRFWAAFAASPLDTGVPGVGPPRRRMQKIG